MRDDTRIDWHRRVDEALIRLLDTLDEPPSFARIAQELASSPYHFHKQFKHLTGETFKECTDRLRLEKAMVMLRSTDKSITDIAFDCGYATVEMLSKAVRKTWGMSPSSLRRQATWHPLIPSNVGIHYSGKNDKKTWFYVQGESDMETKIVQFDEKQFYGYKIVGDYWQLPKTWERLMAATHENGTRQMGKEFMSVFVDADDAIPSAEKRAYAGFVTQEKLKNSFDLETLTIPAGLYAVTVHFGSAEAIGPVWDKWMKEWLPDSGWVPDFSRPNYEWYQNRLDNPELLLTFLVTSVKRKE
jgi:AraC family transcriptional regulator